MKTKKKSFTLIEVLIAISLATTCIFYLLEFEDRQIKKQKEQVQGFKIAENLQEASVKLYEQLYTQQIDWSTIHSKKSHVMPLQDPDWKARATFNLIREDDKVMADAMLVEAMITLLHKDQEDIKNTTTLQFCCVRNAPA